MQYRFCFYFLSSQQQSLFLYYLAIGVTGTRVKYPLHIYFPLTSLWNSTYIIQNLHIICTYKYESMKAVCIRIRTWFLLKPTNATHLKWNFL